MLQEAGEGRVAPGYPEAPPLDSCPAVQLCLPLPGGRRWGLLGQKLLEYSFTRFLRCELPSRNYSACLHPTGLPLCGPRPRPRPRPPSFSSFERGVWEAPPMARSSRLNLHDASTVVRAAGTSSFIKRKSWGLTFLLSLPNTLPQMTHPEHQNQPRLPELCTDLQPLLQCDVIRVPSKDIQKAWRR